MFICITVTFLMRSDFDLYDPRYTRLKSSDWEAFRDPKKYWYTPYVNNRKKLAEEVENGFSTAKDSVSLKIFHHNGQTL